jgi:glutathione-independent formaldehyde dehydrogenase
VLLRDLVLAGRARPGVVVTHHAGLDEAPDLYREFDRRAAGIIKAVLHPQAD